MTQTGSVFASIDDALSAVARGQIVVVVDEEDRENEGDLIAAASTMTPEIMSFFVRHTSGVVCVGMDGDRLDALRLPLMVGSNDNQEAQGTAFTVTVDLKAGVSTGISAQDRCTTVRALADPHVGPEAFVRPGHIFPLRARPGGVLQRAGHTEAAVDLVRLAGLPAAGVLAEVVNDDGSMARLPDLIEFCRKHDLLLISIADLVRWRREQESLVVERASASIPTPWGMFRAVVFTSQNDTSEHVALRLGEFNVDQPVLVRVHSECLTGDIFSSLRCDCGSQLNSAMQIIGEVGSGVVLYLRGHEGRGIGLAHKLRAYGLQDRGADTVDANLQLGLPVDSRDYGIGAQMLTALGVRKMRLLTNNPAKYNGLSGHGLEIVERVPLPGAVTPENVHYLETKIARMGHSSSALSSTPAQAAAAT